MIRLMFFSGILFASAPESGHAPDAGTKRIESFGNWESAGDASGVRTWVRWIHFTDGSKTRERRGEFVAGCDLKGALNVLSDPSAMKRWASGVSENYRISSSAASEWVVYTLYDLPWPFHQRDLVSAYTLSFSNGNSVAVIRIHSKPQMTPLRTGIERLTDYRANWTLRDDGHGTVTICFTAMSDTPPLFPRPIQDPVIESVFHRNLVALRRLMSEKTPG